MTDLLFGGMIIPVQQSKFDVALTMKTMRRQGLSQFVAHARQFAKA